MTIDLVFRVYLVVLGSGLAVHYGLMAAAAGHAPVYMRVAYVVASCGGFAGLVFAAIPEALMWSLVSLSLGAGGALVVALKLWAEGIKVCEVMNHAEAIATAKRMLEVVRHAQDRAVKDAEYLTPSAREFLWAEEDRERAKR